MFSLHGEETNRSDLGNGPDDKSFFFRGVVSKHSLEVISTSHPLSSAIPRDINFAIFLDSNSIVGENSQSPTASRDRELQRQEVVIGLMGGLLRRLSRPPFIPKSNTLNSSADM